jgi:hypothetical protein
MEEGMAKFKAFNPREHISGLAEAALRVQAEELVRSGKMPSLAQIVGAMEETNLEICIEFFKSQRG